MVQFPAKAKKAVQPGKTGLLFQVGRQLAAFFCFRFQRSSLAGRRSALSEEATGDPEFLASCRSGHGSILCLSETRLHSPPVWRRGLKSPRRSLLGHEAHGRRDFERDSRGPFSGSLRLRLDNPTWAEKKHPGPIG